MKKLMLISLVIFFALCSKSWALPECEGSPLKANNFPAHWTDCIGIIRPVAVEGGEMGGVIKNGIINGKGYFDSPKMRSEGIWEDGMLINGILNLKGKVIYIGDFSKETGLWHGYGTLFDMDGSISQGEFNNGQKHGYGTYFNMDGSISLGEFNNGKMADGMAIFYDASGSSVGFIKNGNFTNERRKFYKKGENPIPRPIKPILEIELQKNNHLKFDLSELITKKIIPDKNLSTINIEEAKIECEAIGYKKGTEKFGECVLDLTE